MAGQATPRRQAPYYGDTAARGYFEEDRGYGWVMFAAKLLLILGMINFIEGLNAIA